MNESQESIIREALAVHTEGQEPPAGRTAEEYEAAILAVARLDQHPSENIAQAVARVARDGDPEVTALLFAASRLRDRDAASVGKRAEPSPVALDAERVCKSGSSPRFCKSDYEDEMMKLAKAAARPGEGTAASFARLCGDGVFDDLYTAGERADLAELETVLAKGVSRDERFDRMLLDLAALKKRAGESVEQCASRLLSTDATVMAAYAAVNGH